MSPTQETTRSRPVTEPTLSSHAFEEIRAKILNGELAPGAPLSEYKLASMLEISRTPVRDALRQLGQCGLVRFVPQRGVFVSELTVEDVVEIYQLREELEGLAARVAAERFTEEDLRALERTVADGRRLVESGKPYEGFLSACGIHQTLVAAAGNGRLVNFLSQLDDHAHRIRHLTFRSPGRLLEALAEHDTIVSALRARDGAAAATAMKAHLRADRDTALRQLLPTTSM